MLGEIIKQWMSNGAYYSLLALGFALIFGAARIVNLYHGTFFMLGAFVTYTFYAIGLPLYAAILIALVIVAAIGYGVFRLIEPIRDKGVAVLIVTIGLAYFTQELIKLIYGHGAKALPSLANLGRSVGDKLSHPTSFAFLGTSFEYDRLFVVVIAAFMICLLWLFMEKTKTGRAVMAVAQDEEAAMTVGINPKMVNIAAVSFSAIFAAVAGISTTPFSSINEHMWLDPLIKSFAIVILGGLGSVWGSVLAAFLLAFGEAIANNMVFAGSGEIVFLVVVLVMLVARPQGLMGKPIRF